MQHDIIIVYSSHQFTNQLHESVKLLQLKYNLNKHRRQAPVLSLTDIVMHDHVFITSITDHLSTATNKSTTKITMHVSFMSYTENDISKH